MADLVPSLTLHLVELFRGPLREVRFPDADAERLGASIDAVLAANDLVDHAERALEAAREALIEKQKTVAQETERALAYARIYAAERPELRSALEAIPSRARVPGKRPVGRPRKSTARPAVAPASSDRAVSAAE